MIYLNTVCLEICSIVGKKNLHSIINFCSDSFNQIAQDVYKRVVVRILDTNNFRFTNPEDKKWFETAVTNVCKNHIGEDLLSQLPEEPFFVDFLREAPEPTGEEGEDADLDAPKIYEEVGVYFGI